MYIYIDVIYFRTLYIYIYIYTCFVYFATFVLDVCRFVLRCLPHVSYTPVTILVHVGYIVNTFDGTFFLYLYINHKILVAIWASDVREVWSDAVRCRAPCAIRRFSPASKQTTLKGKTYAKSTLWTNFGPTSIFVCTLYLSNLVYWVGSETAVTYKTHLWIVNFIICFRCHLFLKKCVDLHVYSTYTT